MPLLRSGGTRPAKELALEAFDRAVAVENPPEDLIHHSDQGVVYSSLEYQHRLWRHGMMWSMSRRGNCYDNAVAESFFSSLKKERIRRKIYATRAEARAEIFDYIEVFYNRTRRHSHLGQVSPAVYEAGSNGS